MKKTMLALTGAIIILAGCQDEKPAETTAIEAPQVEETQVPETTEAMPAPEEQVVEEQGISTETFVDSDHNANNALDWNGTYQGTLPCADCPGIDISITLKQDGTYILEQSYQGKEDSEEKSEGQFSWNESGNTVTLSSEEAPNQYFVGENVLMKLDTNGEKVSGELASNYNLIKQQ